LAAANLVQLFGRQLEQFRERFLVLVRRLIKGLLEVSGSKLSMVNLPRCTSR